jgi:hypothetical protein
MMIAVKDEKKVPMRAYELGTDESSYSGFGENTLSI